VLNIIITALIDPQTSEIHRALSGVPSWYVQKRENKYPVNPVVLGLFLFVVLGSGE
jgi:hypothetical protein